MFTTYEEALAWIHTRRGMGPKPGIKRMEWMMEKLHHPERSFPSIHIAGTNGKGSTVAYLTSLFLASGHTVGSFTSPHIMKFNERISLNGLPMDDEDVVWLANEIQPLYEEISQTPLGGLTEFEVITSMMFLYFSKKQPDVVLIEVGLGGLFDSTNVVLPELCVITTIGLDHLQILGNTISEIAFQKAGIMKPKVPVVIGKIEGEAKAVLEQVAQEKSAPLSAYGRDFHSVHHPTATNLNERFDYRTDEAYYAELEIRLMGAHQVENATTALHAYRCYCKQRNLSYTAEMIHAGLKAAFWPVRMEVMGRQPYVILDGAHNEPAMQVLVKTLEDNFKGKRIKVLYAALTTKELSEIGLWLQKIPNADIHLTTFDFPKAASLADLKERMQLREASYHEDWQTAFTDLLATADSDDVILVTGSLYFLSEMRHFILEN